MIGPSPSPSPSMAGSSYSTSPHRSSPLSNPPLYSPSRIPSPSPHRKTSHGQDRAKPRAIPSDRRRSGLSNMSIAPTTSPSPSPSPSPRSPSSMTCSPPLSRSHPLLGSYTLSLLHSRMSHAHAPHSVPSTSSSGFSLHLGAIGKGKDCPPELRYPKAESIPFQATYYDIEDSGKGKGAIQTPWVGTIDLEHHLFDRYSASHTLSSELPPPPIHPGFKIASFGQLQILIKTAKSAVRVFVLPYDLRRLPIGGRLLARERTFVDGRSSDTSQKGSLRFSIQVQFACLPDEQDPLEEGSSTTRHHRIGINHQTSTPEHPVKKAYFVSRSIKVVFTSSPPESHEVQTSERTDEVILPSETWPDSPDRGRGSFVPGSLGRSEEWTVLRQKWMAKKRVAEEMSALQEHPDSPPFTRTVLPERRLSPERALSPVRGFSPLPRKPSDMGSSSPNGSVVGLSMLSQISTSRPPSRSTTPTPAAPALQTLAAQALQTKPANVYAHRQRSRRGSPTREERELSEKLMSRLEVRDE
ncbi:hypothetical protein BD324DRAFT_607160 [Kockovaella imperatae]|uniref:Atos-like conserved domain-containing protein n=1 Tax=Kockovaella imperatae TaxID=4999 RepID=A0A1Y1UPP6_9TREE|nr:hypothetical protein BD324DRAFT_607160 [Kockovaella imperatae]ORX40030.1 hypothetical protein BD324DRAFT_607160 [Kockovaella imperatae]